MSRGEAVGGAWQDQGWPAGTMETRYKEGVGGDMRTERLSEQQS